MIWVRPLAFATDSAYGSKSLSWCMSDISNSGSTLRDLAVDATRSGKASGEATRPRASGTSRMLTWPSAVAAASAAVPSFRPGFGRPISPKRLASQYSRSGLSAYVVRKISCSQLASRYRPCWTSATARRYEGSCSAAWAAAARSSPCELNQLDNSASSDGATSDGTNDDEEGGGSSAACARIT